MEENIKLEDFGVEDMELEKIGTEKIPIISDQSNSLHVTNPNSDNFVVDVARLSHIPNNEITTNSKVKGSFSRKGSLHRSSDKKTNPINDNEKESKLIASGSPSATLGGASTLEKPLAEPLDRAWAQAHHQITIKTTGIGGSESRSPAKRNSFRRSQPWWAFDPRKIFFFLATLSSTGTILLIFFTLSMSKPSGDDSAQNW